MSKYTHHCSNYTCGNCCFGKRFQCDETLVLCDYHQSEHFNHVIGVNHSPCGWWGKDRSQGPGHYYGKFVK